MSNFITNLLLIKDQNITMEDKLDLINADGQDTVEVKTHSNLPEHLCFDEIKSTKDSKNGMSFVFLDARTHDFIDIVDGRTQHILKKYFMRYPRKVRKKIKTICIDIYLPYMNMIREGCQNTIGLERM